MAVNLPIPIAKTRPTSWNVLGCGQGSLAWVAVDDPEDAHGADAVALEMPPHINRPDRSSWPTAEDRGGGESEDDFEDAMSEVGERLQAVGLAENVTMFHGRPYPADWGRCDACNRPTLGRSCVTCGMMYCRHCKRANDDWVCDCRPGGVIFSGGVRTAAPSLARGSDELAPGTNTEDANFFQSS